MKVIAPRGLQYPITVVELLKQQDDDVKPDDKLFRYSYETAVVEGDKWGGEDKTVKKKMLVQFDAGNEGQVARWFVKPGTVIDRPGSAHSHHIIVSAS